MLKSKSAGSLAAALFAAMAILPASAAGPAADTPADLSTESIEALAKRIFNGQAVAVEAESKRRLEEAERSAPDSRGMADILSFRIVALENVGQGAGPEALSLAERNLALCERLGGKEDVLYARALNDRGRIAMDRGEYAAAREFTERALALRERLLGKDDPSLGRVVNNLGAIALQMGDLQAARGYMERALAIFDKSEGPESGHAGQALANLGIVCIRLEDLDSSVQYFERARAVLSKVNGENSFTVAKVLNGLGIAQEHRGDYASARASYEKSLAAYEASLPADHPEIAWVVHNLGVLSFKMGDTKAAVDLTRRALAILQKTSGPDDAETLRIVHSLGTYLHVLGEDDEAEKTLQAALDGRERSLGPDHFDVAESLGGLGTLYLETGRPERALPLLERSLAIREKALGPDHPFVATSLDDLARCEATLGRRDAALPHFERAVAIGEARFGPDHPDVAKSLTDLAEFLNAQDRPEEALPPARRAAAILAHHARETMAGLPESVALHLVDGQPHPEEVLFSGLLAETARGAAGSPGDAAPAGWLPACWEWILARRGAVLDELAARNRRGLFAGTAEAREALQRLGAARSRLARLWVNGGDEEDPGAYRKALDAARAELDAAEVDLARTSAAYKDVRTDAQAGLDEVRRALPAGSVLVEWVRVRAGGTDPGKRVQRDLALLLGPGDAAGVVDLGVSSGVDAAVAAWREALAASARSLEQPVVAAAGSAVADPLAELTRRGEALRRIVWDPLAHRLAGARRVYLVPDGSIHAVDFEALPDRGRYLIETGPAIQILSTGRDLVRYARRADAAKGRGVLAIGAPDFDATAEAQRLAMGKAHAGPVAVADAGPLFRGAAPSCLDPTRARWRPIPASGLEARRVAAFYKGREPALVLEGAAASETRLKEEAPGRRVLHLATHGFFVGETCADAPLSRGKIAAAASNPLLLSGLVLAGANLLARAPAPGDDGILTAEELAALDLSATELVVLSACDTGRGAVAIGEGVFGLRRALEIAGARSVVMSLDPVPDRQAARFMDRFYHARLEGRPIPDAVRAASLQALQDLRRSARPTHPYYWAGFVAAGDWH
jgi:CHAT domain-containing protein/tetratricopeptide (TPR) repeat protein